MRRDRKTGQFLARVAPAWVAFACPWCRRKVKVWTERDLRRYTSHLMGCRQRPEDDGTLVATARKLGFMIETAPADSGKPKGK